MSEKDAFRNLSNAVVIQAADDWRYLCEMLAGTKTPKTPPKFTFKSLRAFFKSEWCALLCGNVDPLFILDALEHERKAALNEI